MTYHPNQREIDLCIRLRDELKNLDERGRVREFNPDDLVLIGLLNASDGDDDEDLRDSLAAIDTTIDLCLTGEGWADTVSDDVIFAIVEKAIIDALDVWKGANHKMGNYYEDCDLEELRTAAGIDRLPGVRMHGLTVEMIDAVYIRLGMTPLFVGDEVSERTFCGWYTSADDIPLEPGEYVIEAVREAKPMDPAGHADLFNCYEIGYDEEAEETEIAAG